MAVNENGNLRPDGLTLSWTPTVPRAGMLGVGGTYYWNPGSPTAPLVTLTGMWGRGRDVWKIPLGPLGNFNLGGVFLRKGMTSADTLGYGTTSNVSTLLPSVSFNTSIPDESGIPHPERGRESSIEAGLSGSIGASHANTYTVTPQQAADALRFIRPAMGPNDELPPFFRMLRTGHATIGPSASPPVPFLSQSQQNLLGDGMGDWRYSAATTNFPPASLPTRNRRDRAARVCLIRARLLPCFLRLQISQAACRGLMMDAGLFNPADPGQPLPGGLPGFILDYLRNSRDGGAPR